MENRGVNQFTDAAEIIRIIEQRRNRGYGIEHFRKYMASLENPHDHLHIIHVAGTNGKGSTANDIRAILQEAGYRVGTFTSPYMITHLDRIRLNDAYISESAFVAITNTYYDSWMQWDLSMFEIDMCIACIYFLQQKADFCIFEVGLGGRLDFTNIVRPLVSVITNIGMDHMEQLGDTYEKIAGEKARIIKTGIPVITAEEKASCLQVFDTIAHEMNTSCIRMKPVVHPRIVDEHACFSYGDYTDIVLASQALYQCKNAALAIAVMQFLNTQGDIHIQEHQIRNGLKKAIWLGRFEIVSHNPVIILDGAHNVDGIHALCESLHDIPNPVIIFSVLRDKNFMQMLRELQTISDEIIVTQTHNSRALDIHELQDNQQLTIIDDVQQALMTAKKKNRPIVITGSLYFISELRAILMP